MGHSASKASIEKIAWSMPSWCLQDFSVTSQTIALANDSWRYSMGGESPPFLAAKAKEHSVTPLVFFYNQFYYLLFELIPEAKPMFTKGMAAQGRMLANVIKYIITKLDTSNNDVLRESLQHLARVHNQRGVTADHYSVMGMVLIHTVRLCTGDAYFTNAHRDAWVHIYSKMMSVIIPVVVEGTIPGVEDLARSEQFGGRSGYGAAAKEAEAQAIADKEAAKAERAAKLAAKAAKAAEKAAAKTAKEAAAKEGGGGATVKDSTKLITPIPRCPASGMLATPGAKCPASSQSSTVLSTEGGCPVAAFESAAHEPVSTTLADHFASNAATHLAELREQHDQQQGALAAKRRSHGGPQVGTIGTAGVNDSPSSHFRTPAEKYRALKSVLAVAQQVEMQLRDQGAEAISGASLIQLMLMFEFVPTRVAALQIAQQLLTMQLMVSVSSGAAHAGHGGPESLYIDRQGSMSTMPNASGSALLTFHPEEHTLYSFDSRMALPGGSRSSGSEEEEQSRSRSGSGASETHIR